MKSVFSSFRAVAGSMALAGLLVAPTSAASLYQGNPAAGPALAYSNVEAVQYHRYPRYHRHPRRAYRHPHRAYRHGGRYYMHGHRVYRHYHHGYRRYGDWWVPPVVFGTLFGGIMATAPRSYGNAHVRWCYRHYRSYRAYDNTYQPYYGPRRQCVSPY